MTVGVRPKITMRDYRVENPNDWCPGCGDFGILSSLQQALAGLNLAPHEVAVFGGIGCSGKAPYYVNAYGIHTLHGRVLPFASGAKLANPELTVVAVGGDGDGLGIGAGHFVNTGRRNIDMTYILFNNEVYGLTKGQAAPTLPLGLKTKSLPEPNIQAKINSLMLALSVGFTWIGRSYAYAVRDQVELMQQAIRHPGLAYLEVLQPCPTYNDLHTKDWFAGDDLSNGRPRYYSLQDEGYDPVVPEGGPGTGSEDAIYAKMCAFIERANEWGDRIPVGVFLDNRSQSTFEDRLEARVPTYRRASPAHRKIADAEGRPTTDLSEIFAEVAM